MNALVSTSCLALAGCSPWLQGTAAAGAVSNGCRLKGKLLYGTVQFVDAFPDFTIEEVAAFPDLKVHKVAAHADSCGEWELVTAFPDFTVQRVSAHADLKVSYVTAFPGVP